MSTTIAMIGVVVAIVLAIALVALSWSRRRSTAVASRPPQHVRRATRATRDEAARERAREAARQAARERLTSPGEG